MSEIIKGCCNLIILNIQNNKHIKNIQNEELERTSIVFKG